VSNVSEEPKLRLWNKWEFEGVKVQDPGLQRYISLKPIYTPHSGGRHEHKRFRKSELNIVERLANDLMRHGQVGGKKAKAMNIVKNAFELSHLKTRRNPIEVFVQAIEHSAPCEDTTRIMYGGIVYHMAVDISPQRRLDLALRFITEGARKAAFGNPKPIEECLADEIILAAAGDGKSHSIQKKDEMERVSLSSR